MRLRKRLALEEIKREGFEDGITGSETEPTYFDSDTFKLTYREARRRGAEAAEGLQLKIAEALDPRR